MAKILSFPQPGDCCAICRYYVPENKIALLEDSPIKYCSHPDRAPNHPVTEEQVKKLTLYRDPENWCPKCERVNWIEGVLRKGDMYANHRSFYS